MLSFFVCWMPFLGIAVSGLGLLLGLAGLVLAILRRGSGAGFSIAGSGLSALSLVVCLVWTFALSSAFKAVDSAVAKQRRANQDVVLDGDPDKAAPQPVVTPEKVIPAPQAKQSPEPPKEKAPPSPTKGEPEWADASQGAVQQGDVRVRVASVNVDFVKGKEIKAFKSKEKLLKITLQIENTNPNRKVDYQGWGATHALLADDAPRLTDNFSNTYKRVNFGLGSRVDGQVRSESIYPGKAITDLLVFEAPLETIEYLRLELPAKNFGGTGKLRLQIPKDMIQR